jgi:predicted nucleotidyltransferase
MSEKIRHLLTHLREGLEDTYGARLRGLYLYGSFARGTEDAESDVDVVIVLDQIDAYGTEVARTSAVVSTLSLESGLSISRVFVSQQDWTDRDSPFLVNVREEAIAA